MHRRAPAAPVVAPPAARPPVPAVTPPPVAAIDPNAPSLAALPPSLPAPSDATAAAPPHHAGPHRAGDEPRARHGDLDAERALLSDARAAMQASDAPRALAILDDHAHRFARGQLAEERDALRVAALALAGDRQGARRRADEFARRHPDSLFLPSVERAVTDTAPSAQ